MPYRVIIRTRLETSSATRCLFNFSKHFKGAGDRVNLPVPNQRRVSVEHVNSLA